MHQLDTDIPVKEQRTLKDFIPLVVTFFVGLTLLSIYQNTMLYFSGVLDSIVNKSFFIHLLHHIGFTAVSALLLAFIFNLLENKKSNLGFKVIKLTLALLLLIEAALVTYYIGNYEALGANLIAINEVATIRFSWIQAIAITLISLTVCHFVYKYISSFYTVISRMYPFTIILFSLFLATLYSDKKPINENKTQYLLERVSKQVFNFNTYEGKEEYPLLKSDGYKTKLGTYFNFKATRPNIKLIIIEGLGANFTNKNHDFKVFMPALQALQKKSLVWTNFLSNTGESHAALPTIIGSLPFGTQGFTHIPNFTNRNTLFSVLGDNGYYTSFNYGGNSALHSYDKFLDEENVDFILDKKTFGDQYTLQEEDAAGITLGYPDKALFDKYANLKSLDSGSKLEVFLTLSTKEPYHIPNNETYINKVENFLKTKHFTDRSKRLISNNEELFSSLLYADEALNQFLKQESKGKDYENTIFIITGTHHTAELPQLNALEKYRVPLIIYSPLLKSAKEFKNLASHADIAPTLIAALKETYHIKVPNATAWLGTDLLHDEIIHKKIPLLRNAHHITDYISGNHFLTDGDVYELNEQLELSESKDEEANTEVENSFDYFKSVNTYITEKNKLIPEALSLVLNQKPKFTKEQTIWIQSVFNGKDFDNAYRTARKLAISEDYDRALLLCEYILSKIPRHADTEILMGRVYSWKKEYASSIKILKEVLEKYPEYEDGYCALMDTYYWSGKNEKVFELKQLAKKNNVSNKILAEKIKRSIKLIQADKVKEEINTIGQSTAQVPKT